MTKIFLLLKSMVQGYTRKDGVVVKPHSDNRVKRAKLNDHQMVLFPAPAKKPIAPNPFKGLDPVKSTGDLFEGFEDHYDWENGHGHVRPRADGARSKCGGPGACSTCNRESVLNAIDKRRRA
jgi:hypothetical protein